MYRSCSKVLEILFEKIIRVDTSLTKNYIETPAIDPLLIASSNMLRATYPLIVQKGIEELVVARLLY